MCEKEMCKANFWNQDAKQDNEKTIQKYRTAMKQCSDLRREIKSKKPLYVNKKNKKTYYHVKLQGVPYLDQNH